jgi:hypothetical protein
MNYLIYNSCVYLSGLVCTVAINTWTARDSFCSRRGRNIQHPERRIRFLFYMIDVVACFFSCSTLNNTAAQNETEVISCACACSFVGGIKKPPVSGLLKRSSNYTKAKERSPIDNGDDGLEASHFLPVVVLPFSSLWHKSIGRQYLSLVNVITWQLIATILWTEWLYDKGKIEGCWPTLKEET